MATPTTLYEYYTSKGQKMPTWQERAPVYESLGLGKASEYVGNESQNVALLGKLVGGSTPVVSNAPVVPTTPAPVDVKNTANLAAVSGKASELNSGIVPGSSGGGATPQSQTYSVKEGDTLSEIAQRLGVSQDQLTGYRSGNPDLIYPGEVLTVGGGSKASTILPETSNSIVSSSDQARTKTSQEIIDEAKKSAEINQKQASEITTLSNAKTIQDLKTALGITDTSKPAQVNFTDTYTALRTSYGLDALEGQISSLTKQMGDIETSLTAGVAKEGERLAPMEILGTRQAKLKSQAAIQLDALTKAKAVLIDEYNTKLSTVNNIMQFKKLDYTNAKEDYETQFSQAVQLQNILTTQKSKELSEQNAIQDNARANMTVMTNLMQDSNLTIDKMSDDFKTTFAKEAIKAGISVDSVKAFLDAKPGMKVDYTTTGTDSEGNDIVSFFSNNNGNPVLIKTVATGGTATTTEDKEIKEFRKDAADIIQKLDKREIQWGAAWDSLHTKYPNASNELIDSTLGGGYDEETKQWWGRASM